MKPRGIFLLAVALAALLISLPALGACAPKAPPKEKIIKVGYLIDLTGPVSATFGKNTLAHFLAPYRNYNETGFFGDVKVDVLWEDYAFNVDRAAAAYKKFKDGGAVVVHAFTTLAAESIQPLSTRDQIPIVGISTTDKLVDPAQWHYTTAPSYTQMFANILKWVKDNWKDTSRKPRVAQIGWDAPIGRGHVAASEQYAQKIGVDIGPWEFIPNLPLDTTPNLLRLRDAKADFVVLQFGSPASVAQVLRDAQKLGLKDKFTWVLGFQVLHWEGTPLLTELSDGLTGISDTVFPEEPGARFISDVVGKYVAPDAVLKRPYFGSATAVEWGGDLVISEAIKRAVAKVGYAKVDGKAVKDAIETIKDFDPQGLKPKLTFGPQQRQGSTSTRMVKVDWKAQTSRPTTDWMESPASYGPDGKVVFK